MPLRSPDCRVSLRWYGRRVISSRHISAEDTLDKVSFADLSQASTVLAMASFFLADAHDIPQGLFTSAQTAATLIQGKQKAMLEVFGLWPF
jgi:hypothetical protein